MARNGLSVRSAVPEAEAGSVGRAVVRLVSVCVCSTAAPLGPDARMRQTPQRTWRANQRVVAVAVEQTQTPANFLSSSNYSEEAAEQMKRTSLVHIELL